MAVLAGSGKAREALNRKLIHSGGLSIVLHLVKRQAAVQKIWSGLGNSNSRPGNDNNVAMWTMVLTNI